MQAAHGNVFRHDRGPGGTRIIIITDQFKFEATGVQETNVGLAETLLDTALLHVEGIETLLPE